MNIFDMYDNYKKQHATEFRNLLKNVADQLLIVAESIPEEYILETFKTKEYRRYLEISEGKTTRLYKKGTIFADFVALIKEEHRHPYDDAAACELDKFMEIYYPGIKCDRSYSLDLYRRTVEFNFSFDMQISDEDFDEFGGLRDDKKDISTSLELFNADITELLQHEFTEDDWDLEDFTFKSLRQLDCGYLTISIPFD